MELYQYMFIAAFMSIMVVGLLWLVVEILRLDFLQERRLKKLRLHRKATPGYGSRSSYEG